MIRRLLAWIHIDWTTPLENRGGAPMLDRELYERRIRADERARVLTQHNTASGAPPRPRSIPGKAHP